MATKVSQVTIIFDGANAEVQIANCNEIQLFGAAKLLEHHAINGLVERQMRALDERRMAADKPVDIAIARVMPRKHDA